MHQETPPQTHAPDLDYEQYLDHSMDLVARVRAAREAAQRKMEEFGDPSEYEVTVLQGQKKDDSVGIQTKLDLQPNLREGQ